MNDEYLSLIEADCEAIVQLLRFNWTDTQPINDWKRIAFQLDGAALISRQDNAALADELEFLSGLALNRIYVLEAQAMDETLKQWKSA